MPEKEVRLQKFLSECGIASRRRAEELIASGRVKVNGRLCVVGTKVNPKQDKVSVDGKRVVRTKNHIYIMLNKPRGYLTSMSDDRGRKCVTDLVKNLGVRVYPIGRLDKDSEGLLLLTNDGEFANGLMHPSNQIHKTYRVTIRSKVTDEQITALCVGVMVEGKLTAPAEVFIIKRDDNRSVIEMRIYEGRNRQIRKMCESLDLEVSRLRRTAIGEVKLGMLKVGDYRELNEREMRSLQRQIKQKD